MRRPAILPQKATRAKLPLRRGDPVEVTSTEEGFVGSYYEATVVAELVRRKYVVEYTTLVTDDFSELLRGMAAADEVRPRPPNINVAEFHVGDDVDAFDNDGWWVGRITGRVENMYKVFFDSTGDELWYVKERLRIHQDWVRGKWVCVNHRKWGGVSR